MRNEHIILQEAFRLMEDGILPAGDELFYCDENGPGSTRFPIEINTEKFWKRYGYVVRRGEDPVATFPIWCPTGDRREPYELRPADFYSRLQVIKLPKRTSFEAR